MYQFYIVEIRANAAGELEHEVFWTWDTDADTARLKGEAKYHEIMSRAAVSTMAAHAAIMFSSEGFPIMHGCYKHAVTPEPVTEAPTEEPAEEPGEEETGEGSAD